MERIRWSQFAVIVSVLFLSVILRNARSDNDWDLNENTKGWIDPHSMLETDPIVKIPVEDREVVHDMCEKTQSDCRIVENYLVECSDKVGKLEKDVERQKELNRKLETVAAREQPFFEHYLRHILGLFVKVKDGTNVGHYEADIWLPKASYEYLSYYVMTQNVSVQEVHSILLKLITNVRWMRGDDGLDEFDGGSNFSGFLYWLNVGGMAVVILVALLQVMSLLRKLRMSLSRFLFLFFFTMTLVCFMISIPWTWWHLYKKKVAERTAAMSKGPPDCTNQMNSLWKTVRSYFQIQSDECQKYYEQLEIDPLWEVPPTQAVAVTFIRFFLEPAKHVGQAIREFMVSAFEGLPIFLWIPVYTLIVLLLVLVLFCFGRYRVSMPFMRIEPAHSDDGRNVAALQGQVQQLQRENEDMKQCLMLPDVRDNAVDERGDGRRSQLQLEETRKKVQDVKRNDLETKDKRNERASPEAPRTLTNLPTDGELGNNDALPRPPGVKEISLGATTSVSSTKARQQPSPDEIRKEKTTAEITPNPNEKELSASLQNADENEEQVDTAGETDGVDLQRHIESNTTFISEESDLGENSKKEKQPSQRMLKQIKLSMQQVSSKPH